MKKKLFSLIIGLLILLVFVVMSLAPQLFTSIDRKAMFDAWLKPSSEHILGTNSLGYDIFAEIVWGAKQTLVVGLFSSILSMLLGILIGCLAATKGIIGNICSGLINIFVLLPRLVCLIVLSVFFGNNTFILIMLIAAFSWSGVARNIKAKVEEIKAMPYIENLSMQGFSKLHIAIYHIIPSLRDVVLSRFLLSINSCIMMESTLSFLGFGDLYYPTWGTIVNFAYKRGAFIRRAYAYLLVPCVFIMLLSLAFYLISIYFEERKDRIDA